MCNKTKSTSFIKELLQWLKAIAFALVIALLLRTYVCEPVRVVGASMENTLFSGQSLLVYKLGYRVHVPRRGDIVVVRMKNSEQGGFLDNVSIVNRIFSRSDSVDYIKRIVGLPGEEIDIDNGLIYIDGEKLDETYTKGMTLPKGMEFPVEIPEGCCFVAGDNRENSRDSREIGFIEFERIKGRAVFRLWPLDTVGPVD